MLALTALTACGGPPPLERRGDDTLNVVSPTADELTAGAALPGSYIVTFRSEGSGNRLQYPNYLAEYRAHYQFLAERYLSEPRVKDIQFLTAIDLSAPGNTPDADDLGSSPFMRLAWTQSGGAPLVGSLARVDFTSEDDAKVLLADWEARGDIWFAEPNGVSQLSQEPPPPERNEFQALATEYGGLNFWWLNAINIGGAFEAIGARELAVPGTPTDADILNNPPIIAVLDSGVDFEHPALKERIWVNTDVNSANCADDVHGCNTTVSKRGKLGDGAVYPYDTTGPGQTCAGRDNNCSHGTHVAGILVADHKWEDLETRRSVAGVCPVCKVMILKIVSKVGKESGILDSSIIAAFKYVALFKRKGTPAVRVVNASFGKFVRSRSVGLLIRLMKEKRGTVVVGAAGNEDTLAMEYPAAFKDAIAVAAVDSRLRKVAFSNFGRWVDVAAPGAAILSTMPGGSVDAKSGTSMATPIVAGVAGLMLARYPSIGFDELRTTILQTSDPSFYGRDFEEGFNYHSYYPEVPQEKIRVPLLGFGLLNANASINKTPSSGLPIYHDADRVKRGCGVTPLSDSAPSPLAPLVLAMAIPLAIAARHSLRALSALLRRRRTEDSKDH